MIGVAHHAQHLWASSAEKSDDQDCCQNQKNDVENRCVIPTNGFLDDLGIALLRNQMKRSKQKFYCQRCQSHGDVKGDQQECGDLESIVLPVDVQNRQNDEIREEKCH